MEDALALVAELVDALVSGTSGESRGGSSPLQGTRSGVRDYEFGIIWRMSRRFALRLAAILLRLNPAIYAKSRF
jgi:hypothetical protein